MNASLELLHELGPREVARHVESLVDLIVDWAADRDDVELITPRDRERRAGIVALRPRHAEAASARLNGAGVTHALREGAIRLSPHCYNTREEIERTLAVLEGVD
jgi:selenocysteine lyase/cysteine desulfurase